MTDGRISSSLLPTLLRSGPVNASEWHKTDAPPVSNVSLWLVGILGGLMVLYIGGTRIADSRRAAAAAKG